MDKMEFYRKNQQCMILIPQIVDLYRSQSFFQASKKTGECICHLNQMSPMLEEMQKEEYVTILKFLLEAQERQDYVLLADILEGDLLPLLQQVQMKLTYETQFPYKEYQAKNLSALRQKNPKLEEKLAGIKQQDSDFIVFPAVNGQPDIKYHKDGKECCMHSSINPNWEAEAFAGKYVQKNCHNYFIFGMGLGYHVLAILEASKLNHVVVLEHGLQALELALRYQDFAGYISNGRLEIIYREDVGELLLEIHETRDKMLLIHYPSLVCLQDGSGKEALENYFISTDSMLEQGKLLEDNFIRLQKMNLPECGEIAGSFFGKVIAVVAGGPSLDGELPALKKYQKEMAVLTVGTSARKLIAYGIIPDAILITDAQETMYRQIQDLDAESIPLCLLSTASADVVPYYNGKVYLVYQEGYAPAEQAAGKHGYRKFQTGGSVTTLALDMALQFGAKQVILLGTDFAYTNHQSHAGGLGRAVTEDIEMRKVETVDGTMAETARNLDIYRRWIENRICASKDVLVYNTAHGARIHGTIEMSLEEIMGKNPPGEGERTH